MQNKRKIFVMLTGLFVLVSAIPTQALAGARLRDISKTAVAFDSVKAITPKEVPTSLSNSTVRVAPEPARTEPPMEELEPRERDKDFAGEEEGDAFYTPPEIEIVSLEDGEVVSGVVEIRASVRAHAGVEKVQLFVEPYDSVILDSKPFQLKWDTRQVADGSKCLVSATVWDRDGQPARQEIHVTVQNGVSKPVALQ